MRDAMSQLARLRLTPWAHARPRLQLQLPPPPRVLQALLLRAHRRCVVQATAPVASI
jgi:hypothetical protein